VRRRVSGGALRRCLGRALPHGLVSWRYLLPRLPPNLAWHRQIWLCNRPPRLPLPLFLVLETLLWLRWVLFSGWRATRRTVCRRREGEGCGGPRFLPTLRLSLGYCFPPAELDAFDLLEAPDRNRALEYVYTHELPGFHRWRDRKLTGADAAHNLLQDKFALAKRLVATGLPVVATLTLVPRGAQFNPSLLLESHPVLFCKPRHGSHGCDAFVLEAGPLTGEAQVHATEAGRKSVPVPFSVLRRAIERDDFLVQPLLANHPELAGLAPGADAVTLRLITERPMEGEPRLINATLEVPPLSTALRQGHRILPLDLATGCPLPPPPRRLPAALRSGIEALLEELGGRPVPYWPRLVEIALAAHDKVPGLYAVAWDFVVTPEGPMLLEGNSGWGTRFHQVLNGGLLEGEPVVTVREVPCSSSS